MKYLALSVLIFSFLSGHAQRFDYVPKDKVIVIDSCVFIDSRDIKEAGSAGGLALDSVLLVDTSGVHGLWCWCEDLKNTDTAFASAALYVLRKMEVIDAVNDHNRKHGFWNLYIGVLRELDPKDHFLYLRRVSKDAVWQ
jgi:hypothetical protein